MADSNEIELLVKAAHYAAEMHAGQFRKSDDKIPYINHPLDVMAKLVEVGQVRDVEVLVASVLHDVVEDCSHKTSIEEIEKRFGKRVAALVAEVTDDKNLSKERRKALQIFNAPKKSKEAMMIKMADKLSNLGDLRERPPVGWDCARIKGYFVWAFFVLEPMFKAKANPFLEEELRAIFAGNFEFEGNSYPCLPATQFEQNEEFVRYMSMVPECIV